MQVPSPRKLTNTNRNPTLKVTADVATNRKNDRKPASLRSLRARRMNRRATIKKSSRCTMPSRTL
jgi:hypothetical protein